MDGGLNPTVHAQIMGQLHGSYVYNQTSIIDTYVTNGIIQTEFTRNMKIELPCS
jgi:hypothetical protein